MIPIGSKYAHEEAIKFNKIIRIPNKINFILQYTGPIHLLSGFKLFLKKKKWSPIIQITINWLFLVKIMVM